MKLMCSAVVEFTNGPPSNKRFLKSCLSIGKQSVKDGEVYLMLQQANKNQSSTKYKIKGNVQMVYTKYLKDGKTTIRLKEPAHDINIKGDPIQLKSFLHVLKLALEEKVNPAIMTLSNLNPKKFSSALKTKVVIKSAANYPVLEGFPRTTEELQLVGLERKSFDRQIFKLQSLRILNLSENKLTSIPHELGMLPSLQELNLANNQLGKSPISKWSWMCGIKIINNLRLLNLSSNQMTECPYQLNKLNNLVSLYLNNNSISMLPQGIGNLTKLRFLSVAKNNLKYLPGNVKNLALLECDISENPFLSEADKTFFCYIKVPHLLDLAARVIKKNRIHYDASVIPYNLVPYLDKTNYCMCRSPCFGSFFKKFALGQYSIAQNTKFSGIRNNQILYECYFCSPKCIKLYSNFF